MKEFKEKCTAGYDAELVCKAELDRERKMYVVTDVSCDMPCGNNGFHLDCCKYANLELIKPPKYIPRNI